MDGEQWLTVRQFADAAGVSIQAVYQRLDKDLSSYLKTENGRKFVNSDALQFVGNSSTCQAVDKQDSSACQEVDKDLSSTLQAELDAVRAERDKLRQDLHALEISAAVSAAERDAARQHEQEQAATIRALTESLRIAQEQLTGAMSLHAGTLRGQLEQAAQRPDDALAKRDAVTVIQADGANDNGKKPEQRPDRQKAHGVVKRPPINPDNVHGDSPKKKKPGILSRLWRHK